MRFPLLRCAAGIALLAGVVWGLLTPDGRRDITGGFASRENSHPPQQEADHFFSTGREAHLAGRFTDATSCFDDALRIDPADLEIVEWRAASRMAARDYQGAFEDFSAVVCSRPDSAKAWKFRAFAAAALNRVGEMEDSVRRAAELGCPVDPEVLLAWAARAYVERHVEPQPIRPSAGWPGGDGEEQFKGLFR